MRKNTAARNSFRKVQKLFGKDAPSKPQVRPVSSTKLQKLGRITWIDIQDPAKADLISVSEEFNLHSLHMDQSLQKGQIAQMDVEDEYVFLLLHFPFLTEDGHRIATSQVSVFLSKRYLLTVHESANPNIRKLFEEYEMDESAETVSPGRILYHIIKSQLSDVASLIHSVSVELDEIEDNVFDDKGSDAFQIGQIRQKIMRLRRVLATQKSVLDELDAVIDAFTGERLEREYEINTNMSRKLWETVEEARETIEIYKDADFTTSTEKTNEILAVLTLLFTLTIPATVIGTFYGMNILLPGGVEAGSWTFLGNYTMLKLVAGISMIGALLMYLNFKRKHWF